MDVLTQGAQNYKKAKVARN